MPSDKTTGGKYKREKAEKILSALWYELHRRFTQDYQQLRTFEQMLGTGASVCFSRPDKEAFPVWLENELHDVRRHYLEREANRYLVDSHVDVENGYRISAWLLLDQPFPHRRIGTQTSEDSRFSRAYPVLWVDNSGVERFTLLAWRGEARTKDLDQGIVSPELIKLVEQKQFDKITLLQQRRTMSNRIVLRRSVDVEQVTR